MDNYWLNVKHKSLVTEANRCYVQPKPQIPTRGQSGALGDPSFCTCPDAQEDGKVTGEEAQETTNEE